MYDRDNELDTDWLEFLNVLTKPISKWAENICTLDNVNCVNFACHTDQTVEDDDETDPEYIAADQIPSL